VAEDVAAAPSAPPAAERPAPSRAERAHASSYYSRFTVAYVLLGMVAAAGIGALVVILTRPAAVQGPPWSTFKPTGSALEIERQISTQVSSEYKSSTTNRLVSVFPGPLETTGYRQSGSGGQTSVQVPITLIAVQPDVSTGKHSLGDYTFFHPDSTVAYEMCGFGDTRQNCGVSSETGANPTALLHREALELALYTLKYVPGTNAVITFLPPPSNPQAAATAILIARDDVTSNLHRPLARTLKPQQVLTGVALPNANNVGALTASRLYTSNYQTLPGDGTAALVLNPAATG